MSSTPGVDPFVAEISPGLAARAATGSSLPMFLVRGLDEGEPVLGWANAAFAELVDVPLAGLVGRGTSVLSGSLLRPVDMVTMTDIMRAGRPAAVTVSAPGEAEGDVWFRLHLDPMRDETGALRSWAGVVVDVTALMVAQAQQAETLAIERRERTNLDTVWQVSELLADLDRPDVLGRIAERLGGSVVSWAGFYMNDGGLRFAEDVDVEAPPSGRGRRHVRRSGSRSGGPVEVDALGDSLLPGVATGVGEPGPDVPDAVQDLLDGVMSSPVVLTDAAHARGSASGWLADDLAHRLPAGLHGRVVEVHPVPGRRRVLGVMVVVRRRSPDVDVADVASVLQVSARRAGLAIDNARLYAREHRLAETLQRAMLPELADVQGLDVWTYYAPNSEHAQVGGDWYDVLQVTTEVVALVIGDVVGHDVEAAAAMGQLRSVVRSYAFERQEPAPVLERVDALVAGMRISRSASLVYGTLSRVAPPEAAGLRPEGADDAVPTWSFEYSRAGHLPPILVRNGMVTLLSDAGGPLIGFGSRPRSTGQADVYPGDVLLLYTDGLIERRDRALRVGLDALVETIGLVEARDAAGIGEELLTRLAEAPEDDVAVVVVRVPDPDTDAEAPVASPRSRRWLLPSEVASIARARHAVRRTCRAWDIDSVTSAELVVSEIVANGVLHGWGHIALRLFDTGDGLRIEVEDSNPAPPITTEGHANRAGGFGMQIVERLADWGWRPSPSGKIVWARIRPGVRLGDR
ncbi:SpoIIE family protein phosphatase [Paraoerskovia sediminicola]|nr:SpoIIE family protein phosphatase [Paraoerskovia sediminicola]